MPYTRVTPEDIKYLTNICGSDRVYTGEDIHDDYSHDELHGLRLYPDVLVEALSAEEVSAIMKHAHERNIPVTPRGQGTGLVGGAVCTQGGIMLSLAKMNRFLELDETNMTLTLEAGVLLMEIIDHVTPRGFLYPPDPGEKSATIGGNICTNAGGMRAVKYGTTRDYVLSLQVVLANGDVIEPGSKVVKTSSGYSLIDLFVGSEGALGIVTKATLKLLPLPKRVVSLLVPFPDLQRAIRTVPKLIASKQIPTAVEFLEREVILAAEDFLGKKFPDKSADAYLLISFDGHSKEYIDAVYQQVADFLLFIQTLKEKYGIRIPCFGHAGVGPEYITIIVGTGMHRPSTKEEHIHLVGEEIYNNYRIIDHDARDPERLKRVSENPPVSINTEFAEADFKIVTGFIEPHFMAGCSGGRKGVCPALVDLETVQNFHGFKTLSSPKATAGILTGNPCHEIAVDGARKVGVDFLFNVTLNKEFAISGIFCGDLEKAHQEGCRFAAEHAGCTVDEPYDLFVTNGGGYPLDCNYYQTVKGMCMALPAVKSGGTILQISECREGTGSDAFTDMLQYYRNDWKHFLHDIEENKKEIKLDQWEFQMLCRVLEKIGIDNLYVILEGVPEKERQFLCCTPLKPVGDIGRQVENFITDFSKSRPEGRIAIIPAGPYTIIQ